MTLLHMNQARIKSLTVKATAIKAQLGQLTPIGILSHWNKVSVQMSGKNRSLNSFLFDNPPNVFFVSFAVVSCESQRAAAGSSNSTDICHSNRSVCGNEW